jgi:catechol 2,3-dioxygenase-like lactoylglutathione lyase family enzyme
MAHLSEPSLHFLWLEVTDLQRSVDFYRETLGFPVQDQPGPFAIVHLGQAPLYLAPGAPRGLGLYIAIAVPDIEAMYRRLDERRYPVAPPVDEGWARYLNVIDPDGYRLILLQLANPSAHA